MEIMLSHAWAGSVAETYNCLQNLVNHTGDTGRKISPGARLFFCTFSMYQPNDGAPGGLSVAEQVDKAPFLKIIESRPKHGMFVLHTTLSEVYERLWVVHEADVGVDSKIPIRGAFDLYMWNVDKFRAKQESIDTSKGECGVEKDRQMIHDLIMKRGGYERLDKTIVTFRATMLNELKEFLEKFKTDKKDTRHEMVDEETEYKGLEDGGRGCAQWRFSGGILAFRGALAQLHHPHEESLRDP